MLALLALAIQGAKAKVRLGSSALTLGTANPLVSVIEDALSLVMAVAGVLVPLAAIAALLVFIVAIQRRRARIA